MCSNRPTRSSSPDFMVDLTHLPSGFSSATPIKMWSSTSRPVSSHSMASSHGSIASVEDKDSALMQNKMWSAAAKPTDIWALPRKQIDPIPRQLPPSAPLSRRDSNSTQASHMSRRILTEDMEIPMHDDMKTPTVLKRPSIIPEAPPSPSLTDPSEAEAEPEMAPAPTTSMAPVPMRQAALSMEPAPTMERVVSVGSAHSMESAVMVESASAPALPVATGHLTKQLLALFSQLTVVEAEKPTVMASDYAALQARVAALETEKATWAKRQEAIWALRDDDVANLITVRGLLAKERREHDAMKQLREEDLANVLTIRGKLAAATRKLDAINAAQATQASAASGHPRSATSARQSLSGDLWQVAKNAALEQRLLELERANAELKSKKMAEEAMEAEKPAPGSDKDVISRIEAMFDDHLRAREKLGAKVQQLRSEKEVLQKDLARLEDVNVELEGKVERLLRKC